MSFMYSMPKLSRACQGLRRGVEARHSQMCWIVTKREKSDTGTLNMSSLDGATQFESNTGVGEDDKLKPFSAIPGPKGLPYFGLLFHYKTGVYKIDQIHHVIRKYYNDYGKIMKETVNGNTVVHIFDPDYVKAYFYQEDAEPTTPPLIELTKAYRHAHNQSPGLGNSTDKEWYRLRSGVNHAMLKPRSVQNYFPMVNSVAEEFLKKIMSSRDGNNEVPNLQNEIYRWTMETAWGIAFDSRLGCMENTIQDAEDIIDAKNEIFHQSTMLKSALPWYKYFPTPRKKKVFAAEDVIVRIIKKHTDIAIKKINDLEESGELRDDQFSFLRYLLSRPQLDYSDVLILSLSLPVDGISTTSRIFSFNLYSLAKNPDVQEKLFKEIDLYYHGDDPLTSENLQKMSYLKACVKESFRFFPVGVDISRVTKKDMVIGGYHIPAGTQVEMNNFVMSRLPEYFEEPERFRPERWIRDEAEHDVHPFIMLPFGHGPRMCIGRRIAEQEIYTMMAKLVKNFHLEWHYEDMGMSYNMLMDPSRPTQIRFVDRK